MSINGYFNPLISGDRVLLDNDTFHRIPFTDSILNQKFPENSINYNNQGIEKSQGEYILFLNADIPKVNGIDLLTKIKKDDELKKMPVIILATKDDTQEVELCHELGCSIYIAKPTEPKEFVELIRKVGLFLSIIRVPQINGVK